MKNKSKALLLVVCAILLVAASVFGTLAYLTDQAAVKNTFTVGQVYLTLNETKVTEDGKPVPNADRVQENKYHLLPGHTYTKDPKVTVTKNSESAYVRMLATITYQAEADAVFGKYGVTNWLNIDTANWKVNGNPVTVKDETNGTISRTYEFRHVSVVPKNSNADTPLAPLFDTLTIPGAVTSEEMVYLNNMSISVVAHAIQSAGFGNADEAWIAFGTQHRG